MNRRNFIASLAAAVVAPRIPVGAVAPCSFVPAIIHSELICVSGAWRSYLFPEMMRFQVERVARHIPEDGKKWTIQWKDAPIDSEVNVKGDMGRLVATRSSRSSPERIDFDQPSLVRAILKRFPE